MFCHRDTRYIPFWTEFHGIRHDALSPGKRTRLIETNNLWQKSVTLIKTSVRERLTEIEYTGICCVKQQFQQKMPFFFMKGRRMLAKHKYLQDCVKINGTWETGRWQRIMQPSARVDEKKNLLLTAVVRQTVICYERGCVTRVWD